MHIDTLFAAGGTRRAGAVRWGERITLDSPGVYVVTVGASTDASTLGPEAPLDSAAINTLLRERPEALLDNRAATPALIRDRLQSMWIPGQSIVYIGRAGTSVQKRVDQFYRTKIGARAPHAGGWPIKMLQSDILWVHYGATNNDAAAEDAMLKAFISSVPETIRTHLIDPARPLPFANLELSRGQRKQHGFRNVKARRTSNLSSLDPSQPGHQTLDRTSSTLVTPKGGAVHHSNSVKRTQNVTAKDLERGALRVPSVSKSIFPADKQRITVQSHGAVFDVSWDPRTAGDKERSGTIRLGRQFMTEHLIPGGPLQIELIDDIYVIS